MVAPAGTYLDRLSSEFETRPIDLGGGSMNPLTNLVALRSVRQLVKEIQPDLIHNFTIKCVLYGGYAARRQRIPVVNAVTGLGHIFTEHSLKNSLVRRIVEPMYKFVLDAPLSQVIFQNEENQDFFLNNRLVRKNKTHLIRGSGADCERFCPNESERESGPIRLLFASRLIREKGINELLEACRQLRQDGEDFELIIAGDVYPDNPSSLSPAELEQLKEECSYLGHVDDVQPHFQRADVVVLPSYAEGTPRVLLEAGACGKPLVATDIAGCHGVVVPNENGFLVPPLEIAPLKEALRTLIGDSELRSRFGEASRRIIEEGFSEAKVVEETLGVYKLLEN